MAFLTEDRRSGTQTRPHLADAADIYVQLRSRPSEIGRQDAFTAHIFACALAIGLAEAGARAESLGAILGLGRRDLERLIINWAPEAAPYVDLDAQPDCVSFDEEEDQLRELLERFRGNASEETGWLIAILTKRSMAPRHLWQDLGLFRREELGRLIGDRFPRLAARNTANMKWKKFFYRSLCELEGFVLCAAPTCRECSDFSNCFGDESGESALARIARPTTPNA
ncbi:MAG: nitrogen fixation protein NifQ [Methylocystaceae bacterium]|nr:MAG: nitrogen fixation protein NifQ [Methylocystaceae bacterium]